MLLVRVIVLLVGVVVTALAVLARVVVVVLDGHDRVLDLAGFDELLHVVVIATAVEDRQIGLGHRELVLRRGLVVVGVDRRRVDDRTDVGGITHDAGRQVGVDTGRRDDRDAARALTRFRVTGGCATGEREPGYGDERENGKGATCHALIVRLSIIVLLIRHTTSGAARRPRATETPRPPACRHSRPGHDHDRFVVRRMPTITTTPITADHWDDVQEIFAGGGDGPSCQCMWPMLRQVDFSRTPTDELTDSFRSETATTPAPIRSDSARRWRARRLGARRTPPHPEAPRTHQGACRGERRTARRRGRVGHHLLLDSAEPPRHRHHEPPARCRRRARARERRACRGGLPARPGETEGIVERAVRRRTLATFTRAGFEVVAPLGAYKQVVQLAL